MPAGSLSTKGYNISPTRTIDGRSPKTGAKCAGSAGQRERRSSSYVISSKSSSSCSGARVRSSEGSPGTFVGLSAKEACSAGEVSALVNEAESGEGSVETRSEPRRPFASLEWKKWRDGCMVTHGSWIADLVGGRRLEGFAVDEDGGE